MVTPQDTFNAIFNGALESDGAWEDSDNYDPDGGPLNWLRELVLAAEVLADGEPIRFVEARVKGDLQVEPGTGAYSTRLIVYTPKRVVLVEGESDGRNTVRQDSLTLSRRSLRAVALDRTNGGRVQPKYVSPVSIAVTLTYDDGVVVSLGATRLGTHAAKSFLPSLLADLESIE